MLGTRWESSQRPLFVRTVWKDGHHHVMLKKEPEEKSKITSYRSARPTARPYRSAKKKSAPASNFRVPSVKLFVTNWRNQANNVKRCKTETTLSTAQTMDIVPSDRISYNDLNKQISFQDNDNKKKEKIRKSRSVEVNNNNNNSFYCDSPLPPFSYNCYCLDQCNSLSERVLMWLDLAIQNQKQFKNFSVGKNFQDFDYSKEMHLHRVKEKEETSNDDESSALITSKIEASPPIEKQNIRVRSECTTKRQLHIFLPHIISKKSDSASFISSKSSSY